MMLHPHIRTLSRYLDGVLDEGKSRKVESHLTKCAVCRRKMELLKAPGAMLPLPHEKIEKITHGVMANLPARKWNTSTTVIGEITSVIGMVLIRSFADDEGVEASAGMALRKGDTLVTRGESKALVRLKDGSEVFVNKDTSLDFQPKKFDLGITLGEIFTMIKPQRKSFIITTPSAVLGVIGTDFDTKVTKEKETILSVIKGSVYYKNNSGKTIVTKKHQVKANPVTKPVPVKISDTRSISDWTGSITPTKRNGGWIMKKLGFAIVAIVVIGVLGMGGYWLYNTFFGYVPYSYTPSTTPTPAAIQTTVAVAPTQVSEQIPELSGDIPTSIIPDNNTLVSRVDLVIGRRVVFQVDQVTKSVIQIQGQPRPIETRQVVSQKLAATNLEEQAGGIYVVELEFISLAMEQESPEGKYSVSSDSPQPQDQNAILLWSMVKATSGSKIYYYLTKDMEIMRIDGVEEIRKKIRASTQPQIAQLMEANLNEDTMKDMFKMYGNVLPEKPVKVGNDWSYSSKMEVPMLGKTKTDTTYRFVRWDEHRERMCVVLDMSGTITSKGEPSTPGLIPKIAIRNGNIAGTLWYDPQSGETLDSVLNQSLDMEISQMISDRRGAREQKISGHVTSNVITRLIEVQNIY